MNENMKTRVGLIKLTILFAVSTLFIGCGGFVKTKTTNFHGQDHQGRGTISVIPINAQQEDSLEFRTVSNYALTKFAEVGYTPISPSNDNKPSYIFFMSYGIDDGTTKYETVPVYGSKGGNTSYTYGGFSDGTSFNATTYEMPTYGVVGSKTTSNTEFKRVVNIDVYNVEQSKPSKVYEMKTVSMGSCENINSVINAILDGMFKDFPGENGEVNSTLNPREQIGGC